MVFDGTAVKAFFGLQQDESAALAEGKRLGKTALHSLKSKHMEREEKDLDNLAMVNSRKFG